MCRVRMPAFSLWPVAAPAFYRNLTETTRLGHILSKIRSLP